MQKEWGRDQASKEEDMQNKRVRKWSWSIQRKSARKTSSEEEITFKSQRSVQKAWGQRQKLKLNYVAQ